MSAQKKIQIQNINTSDENAQTVDVLYQKMGDRWYAFSLVGEEVFVGSLSEDEILNANNGEVEKLLEIT
jgi:hypothetical protein